MLSVFGVTLGMFLLYILAIVLHYRDQIEEALEKIEEVVVPVVSTVPQLSKSAVKFEDRKKKAAPPGPAKKKQKFRKKRN